MSRTSITQMQVVSDCDTGYDLDGCQGATCLTNIAGPAEDGAAGIDNGLLFFDQFCFGSEGVACTRDLGTLDQAFHDAICTGGIDIEIEVDAVPDESCAVVTVSTAGGESSSPIPMNLSGDGCLSGMVGAIPIQLGDGQGTIENAVVRMTVSPTGFSDGVLGGTVQGATAEVILDAIGEDLSRVGEFCYDINADLSGGAGTACDSLSMTLEIGGEAIP